MTDQEKEESGQIPPKIKLKKPNGDGEGNAAPEGGQGEAPPKAKPIAAPKSDTSRVDIPDEKIDDLESTEGKADETMRVVLPKADETQVGTLRMSSGNKPKRTIKIKRPDAVKTKADDEGGEAEQKKTVAQARPAIKPKEDTSRIDISKAHTPPNEEQVESAKDETMNVILEEMSEKGDTGKIESGNGKPKPPRTVKIKRDSFETTGAATQVDSEEKKSETAKLDLPDSAADEPGAKKTIRIKRSGAGAPKPGGKTLKISRPESVAATPLPTAAEETRARFESVGGEAPHALFTVAAMLTVIVSGVLIYLLCTQMPFGDSLPWPNKIITEWQGSTKMI